MTDLLCACLRPGDGNGRAAVSALSGRDQWGRLLDLAERHDLAPFLAWRLDAPAGDAGLPLEVRQQLTESRRLGAARNLVIFRDLERLLSALGEAGVPAIVLKGPHLAEHVYQSPELRQMRDLDILVPGESLGQASAVASRLGYEPPREQAPEETLALSQHVPPLSRRGAVPVELHWSIEKPGNPYAIDIEGLWRRSVPARFGGTEAAVLSPEDLLLHLCLHAGYHHRFDISLQAFCDLGELIGTDAGGISWPVVERRTADWAAARPVHLCLSLAHELLRAAVPADVLTRLKPPSFRDDVYAAARGKVLTGSDPDVPRVSGNLARLWGDAPPGGRWAYLRERIFLPRGELARLYPRRDGARHGGPRYLARLGDLFRRHGRAVWGLVRGDRVSREAAARENVLTEYLGRR